MKPVKMILVLALAMLPLLCQAQKSLFNTYNDMKGVSSVYISKAMIEMNPNLFASGDIYIGKVSGQLNSVQILSTMDNNIKRDMRKDIRSLVQSSKYELLMKQKGTVSSSEFYISRKGDKVKELIMFIDGAASLKFVYLEGDMTLKDIQNIMNYQQNSMNTNNKGSLYRIPNISYELADANTLEALKNLDNLPELKSLEGLKNLKSLSKLKDNKELDKQMDPDTWKRFDKQMKDFDKQMEELDKQLEKLDGL